MTARVMQLADDILNALPSVLNPETDAAERGKMLSRILGSPSRFTTLEVADLGQALDRSARPCVSAASADDEMAPALEALTPHARAWALGLPTRLKELAGWRGVDAAHAQMSADAGLIAAAVFVDGVVDLLPEFLRWADDGNALERSLVALFTHEEARVDTAMSDYCALVRIGSAFNPLPTQRFFDAMSDPCVDVAEATRRMLQSGNVAMTIVPRLPEGVEFSLRECECLG